MRAKDYFFVAESSKMARETMQLPGAVGEMVNCPRAQLQRRNPSDSGVTRWGQEKPSRKKQTRIEKEEVD